jgi:hypothetical protein
MDSEVGDMKRQLDYRARQAQRDIDVQTQAFVRFFSFFLCLSEIV